MNSTDKPAPRALASAWTDYTNNVFYLFSGTSTIDPGNHVVDPDLSMK